MSEWAFPGFPSGTPTKWWSRRDSFFQRFRAGLDYAFIAAWHLRAGGMRSVLSEPFEPGSWCRLTRI
jgi:hypothetical protein